MAALLDSCSDMVIRCDDGSDIACVKYTCMTMCDAIRNLVEDIDDLERDDRGRVVVPFPGVNSTDLALAVYVMHHAVPFQTLTRDTAVVALRGLRALGHAAHLCDAVLEHLWGTLRECNHIVHLQGLVDDLMHHPTIRDAALQKMATLCPTWTEFSARVLSQVSMDTHLAAWLVRTTRSFFPAGPVFLAVLRKLRGLDGDKVMRLFVDSDVASCCHPTEMYHIMSQFNTGPMQAALGDTMAKFLWMLSWPFDAEYCSLAPSAAAGFNGTVRCYEDVASALLTTLDARHSYRRITPWLRLHVVWAVGSVAVYMDTSPWTDVSRRVREHGRCEVRITAYAKYPDEAKDLVYTVRVPNPNLAAVSTDEPSMSKLVAGDPTAFNRLVASSSLKMLRVDVYHSKRNVVLDPFF
jgi:hypothetical protein